MKGLAQVPSTGKGDGVVSGPAENQELVPNSHASACPTLLNSVRLSY